jgi:glycerol-3-phosphate dehydrogenase (NAD(P)+)
MKRITILGAGAWGTAIATLLADNGHSVLLWCHEPEVAQDITKNHTNQKYLPGVLLSERITATHDLKTALEHAQWIFEAVPVAYLRAVLQQAKAWYSPDQRWVVMSKGIEQETVRVPTQIIDDVFGAGVHKAVVAGPSFAADLVKKQITGVVVASESCDDAIALQTMLANAYCRPYITTDILGVQLGSALKNVIALGIGMLKGAGYADNAQAYVLTRGLREMAQLSCAMGGKQETVYGLSGMGDLVLTSMGSSSKNMALGTLLGAGESLEEIAKKFGTLPEGVNTVKSIYRLAHDYKLTLPLCSGIYVVLFEQKSLNVMLQELMSRPLENECPGTMQD